MAMVDVVMCCL